jgi:hypothetical protein
MGLSSSTLLHQTSYSGLTGIIRDKGFKVLYSLEEIKSPSPFPFKYAFPMISFSDIPFSELSSHLYKYGGFSIGIKREWIIRNKFSPVCYFSSFSELLRNIIERLVYYQTKLANRETISADEGRDYELIIRLLSYIKNYEGALKLKKKNKQYSNYRFSDEREWRFVPSIAELQNDVTNLILPETEYQHKDTYINKIGNPTIPITINDIKYIIVDQEHQIEDLRNKMVNSFSPASHEINKINFFTAKQCENDFLGLAHDVEEPFTP